MKYNSFDDFEPGELMPWQEMSRQIRQLTEICGELASIFGAEHSDIKTRLDDLEEAVGKMQDSGVSDPDESWDIKPITTPVEPWDEPYPTEDDI